MPRPLLRPQQTSKQLNINIQEAQQAKRNEQLTEYQLSVLQRNRSHRYMDLMKKLDLSGHTQNQQLIQEIIDMAKQEMPEINLPSLLIGWVAKCYLGHPFDVHMLDAAQNIIKHFEQGEPMPEGLEKARGLASYGQYEFIEVYSQFCLAVCDDGSTVMIR